MKNNHLQAFLILASLESLISLGKLLSIPTDQKNSVFLGLSFSRLLMAILFLCFALFFCFSLWQMRKKDNITQLLRFIDQNHSKIRLINIAVAIIFLLLSLTPDYRFGDFSAYYQRLQPFFWFFFLVSITFIGTLEFQQIKNWFTSIHKLNQNTLFVPACLFTLLFFGGILFIAQSRWGISSDNEAWYQPGIPVHAIQVILLIILSFVLVPIFTNHKGVFSNQTVLFFLVWIIAALIWSSVPMKRHFFAPGPYLPNEQFYPYSDASAYAFQALTAKYGLGFRFGYTVVKPILVFWAFLLDLASNSQTNLSMMIQSAIYAILPALLFLFSSKIAGKFCGFLSAGLMILQEWNALNTTQILTINSRLLMSEFMLQICFFLFVFFFFRWLNQADKALLNAAVAGGFVAVGVHIRLNFLAMIPAVVLLSFLSYGKKLQVFFISNLVFLLSIIISITPWIIRSYQATGEFLPEIFGTFSNVVVEQRWQPITAEKKTNQAESPDSPTNSTTTHTVITSFEDASITTNETNDQETKSEELRLTIHPLIDAIGNHTMHNLVSSFLILPTQLTNDDLDHLYGNIDSVWLENWRGHLTINQWLLLATNILIVSLALAYLWRAYRFAGISIIYFWLVFAAAIGVGRTSSGRYIVPMNWIMILLYSLGLTLFLQQCKQVSQNHDQQNNNVDFISIKSLGLTFLSITPFFLLFTSMAITEKVPDYQIITKSLEECMDSFESAGKEAEINADWHNVEQQVKSGQIQLLQGKALFPRFYYYRTGESGSDLLYLPREYSRITFSLIDNPYGVKEMMLPHTTAPELFPHGADVMILACAESHYIDVLAITGTGKNGEVFSYFREPMQELSCPIAEPVCTAVEVCK